MRNGHSYILDLKEVDKTKIQLVGGKGASLGELTRMEGITVPDGFCITTEAFMKIVSSNPSISKLIGSLSLFTEKDRA